MKFKFFSFITFLVICIISACNSAKLETPTFLKVEKMRPNLVQGKIALTGNAVFNNPNAFGLNLTATEIDVYVDGDKVSHVSQKEKTAIEANSNFSVPINVTFSLKESNKGLLGKALDIINKNGMAKVEYKGNIKVGALGIEVPVAINYAEDMNLASMLQ